MLQIVKRFLNAFLQNQKKKKILKNFNGKKRKLKKKNQGNEKFPIFSIKIKTQKTTENLS